ELISPEAFLSPDPALHVTLSHLRAHFPLAALTNNPHEIGVRCLRALGIGALFDTVTGLDDSGESKPSWGPFQHALTQLHVPVNGVLMIGDRYDVDLEPVICRGGGAILVETREDVSRIPDVVGERYALPGRR
nr:HAD family hydrolase [Spirochaeta sp.]